MAWYRRRVFAILGMVFVASTAVMAPAGAQSTAPASYPSQPIRVIVGFAAGGTSDLLARALSEPLGQLLGQPVVVDNQAGAAGTNGMDAVAKARPDGYTIGLGTAGNLAIRPAVQTGMPYDPRRDLQPISLLATIPTVMMVTTSLPVTTVEELIAYAKARPGALTFASSGIGNSSHLSAELFKMVAGVDIAHAPYRGSAPALHDLMNGQVQVMFDSLRVAIGQVRSNQVRALALTGRMRSPWVPDLPTMAEADVVGCEFTAWYGVVGPRGLPHAVVDRLHGAVAATMDTPSVKAYILQLGAEPVASTPAEFAVLLDIELAKWAKVAKSAGIAAN